MLIIGAVTVNERTIIKHFPLLKYVCVLIHNTGPQKYEN